MSDPTHRTSAFRPSAVCGALAALIAVIGATPTFAQDQASYAEEPAAEEAYVLDIAFVTHLDVDLPEQDVYIEREPGSGEVYRVTKGDNDMSAQLYAAAHEVDHNPFDPAAIGPHPKGEALGITLGEWLAQKGSGTYTCQNGEATVDLNFTGLVPGGVYTIWHAFIAIPPPEPFTGTLDLPLGARDGSESYFTANEDGTYNFVRSFKPCLEMSDVWTTSMLALNYHSDGKTWGGHPGQAGYNAHIPLFMMLPAREGI